MSEELTEAGGRIRLHVAADLGEGAAVPLSDGQSHYLLHVMRARAGDRVRLFNGRDGEWAAEIATVTKRGVIVTARARTLAQAEVPDLWLCFAPVKKTPADYLAQKATELGVARLQPVFTRRTIVSRVNQERLLANAVEAAEQSERLSVPEISAPLTLEKLLASWPAGRRLYFCDEGGDAKPFLQALCFPPPLAGGGTRPAQNAGRVGEGDNAPGDGDLPPPKSFAHDAKDLPSPVKGEGHHCAAILTGPEGGFDPAERELLRAQSFVTAVTLGPRILRADTAALAALAVWQSVAGDWV